MSVVFAVSQEKKNVCDFLLKSLDYRANDFKLGIGLGPNDPTPEFVRHNLNLAKNSYSTSRYSDSLERLRGISILVFGASGQDIAIKKTYFLLQSDEKGREFFLNVLNSQSQDSFSQNFYSLSEHILSRDLQKSGAGSKKILRSDYLIAMENFTYLGIKTMMVSKGFSDLNIPTIRSFLECKNEEELKKTSEDNYLSSNFNSYKSQFERIHADIQTEISERFDLSRILSLVGLGELGFFDGPKPSRLSSVFFVQKANQKASKKIAVPKKENSGKMLQKKSKK